MFIIFPLAPMAETHVPKIFRAGRPFRRLGHLATLVVTVRGAEVKHWDKYTGSRRW
ncbi:hypothetical protein HRbin36_02169 [bacterium HR36]|nr:hypothetical protein HRbin36_02169 [bacterium HR36]